jgi:hypothetical protein
MSGKGIILLKAECEIAVKFYRVVAGSRLRVYNNKENTLVGRGRRRVK